MHERFTIGLVLFALIMVLFMAGCGSDDDPVSPPQQAEEPIFAFVQIPPATASLPVTFTMGSTVESDETLHQVTLSNGFTMANTEITNGQFVAALQWALDNGYVTASAASVLDALDSSTSELIDLSSEACLITFENGEFSTSQADYPVVEVSWRGAVSYCDWLSMQAGLSRVYNHGNWSCNDGDPYSATGYRLPTEAEWEFACRAGTVTHFNTGDCLDSDSQSNFDGTASLTGCPSGSTLWHPVNVASYAANAWGLFDMHGNVDELCNDWEGDYSGAETDPTGSTDTTYRIFRGGSWVSGATDCRSASRSSTAPGHSLSYLGFRPVKSN